MNINQRNRFYFPAWSRCAKANDWRMQRGRLLADLRAQAEQFAQWPDPARDAALQVLDYAYQLAGQDHRAVTAEDLRHGCNLVATGGRTAESGTMNNRETNRVAVLFGLLQEPNDLDAVMEWLNPAISDKRGLTSFIRKQAPEATLTAIARNAYGTAFWEDLDAQQLRWLLKQVKGRKAEFRKPMVAVGDDGHLIEQPF